LELLLDPFRANTVFYIVIELLLKANLSLVVHFELTLFLADIPGRMSDCLVFAFLTCSSDIHVSTLAIDLMGFCTILIEFY